MGFRLAPTSVTLNLKWRDDPYFALFHRIR